ncbi:ComEA family DNA-binding protein [Hydromonas duriensis]|uniref:Helix-hairpin-helix protein n=1 Tax=Hydromonas duriensis TaxID=1527608 RepID=A0A4R6Y7S8_9BURK|nr:DUF655 domain-containing protein [Hydromonas duriensis]TDR31409.1 helix-hairpin-helix protein [Hydromonas duriensis]
MRFSMLKRMVVVLGLCLSVTAQAVDINVGTQFQLEAIRGIGPKMAERIINERNERGLFKSWDDFSARVKGVGDKKLQTMQADGLTLTADVTANPK